MCVEHMIYQLQIIFDRDSYSRDTHKQGGASLPQGSIHIVLPNCDAGQQI